MRQLVFTTHSIAGRLGNSIAAPEADWPAAWYRFDSPCALHLAPVPQTAPRNLDFRGHLAGTPFAHTPVMSNASMRNEGKGEEIGGKIKAGVGKLIGNEQMEAEGRAKELKGKAKQETAKSAERTKGKVQEAVGAVKNRLGAVIDDEQMEAEGRAKELEGEARQALNRK
jgi:uncharacterized protein YjbJ (UPF0337 family)